MTRAALLAVLLAALALSACSAPNPGKYSNANLQKEIEEKKESIARWERDLERAKAENIRLVQQNVNATREADRLRPHRDSGGHAEAEAYDNIQAAATRIRDNIKITETRIRNRPKWINEARDKIAKTEGILARRAANAQREADRENARKGGQETTRRTSSRVGQEAARRSSTQAGRGAGMRTPVGGGGGPAKPHVHAHH